MTTYYVSNSTANGYAVGNDSNTTGQAISKSTPWLTVTHFVSACAAGDTCIINDGTYLEAGFINLSSAGKANLTFQAQTQGLAILQTANGADTRIMLWGIGNGGLIIDGLCFDGQGVQSVLLNTAGNSNASTVIVRNCIFKNANASGASSGLLGPGDTMNVTIQNNTFQLSAGVAQIAIYLAPGNGTGYLNGQIYTITGNTITCVGTGNVATTGVKILPLKPQHITKRTKIIIRNNVITFSTTGTTSSIFGVNGVLGADYDISGNTITLTGPNQTSSGAQTGIDIVLSETDATLITYECNIVANTFSMDTGNGSTGVAGHGICVGRDGPSAVNPNMIKQTLIANNSIIGGNHGILCAWIGNYTVIGNYIKNTVIGIIDKFGGTAGVTIGLVVGNKIVSLVVNGGGALRAKASSGVTFKSNLVIYDTTDLASSAMLVNDDATNHSTGVIFQNNIIYNPTTSVVTSMVSVAASNTATFTANNYYSKGGFGSAVWSYQGVNYATFAAWVAAQEVAATNVDSFTRTYATRTLVAR